MVSKNEFIKDIMNRGVNAELCSEVSSYLNGQTDKFNKASAGMKSYDWYDLREISQGLKENRALAVKMCKVLVSLFNGKIKISYGEASGSLLSIYIATGSNYKEAFTKVMDNSYEQSSKYSYGNSVECTMKYYNDCKEVFIESPEEATTFISSVLAKPVDKNISEFGDYIPCVMYLMVCGLDSDKDKYKDYIPALLEYCDKVKPEYSMCVISRTLDIDDIFIDKFRVLINNNFDFLPEFIKTTMNFNNLPYSKGDSAELKTFLVRNELPIILYYIYDIVCFGARSQNVVETMAKLRNIYNDNREIFYKLFELLKTSKKEGVNLFFPTMTAILLDNKDPKASIEYYESHFGHFMRYISDVKSFGVDQNAWKSDNPQITDKILAFFAPSEKAIELFQTISYDAIVSISLRAMLPLYHHSSIVKQIIDGLFEMKAHTTAIISYPAVMEACYGKDVMESVKWMMEEKGVTIHDFAMADYYTDGKIGMFAKDIIKALIKSDQKAASAIFTDWKIVPIMREKPEYMLSFFNYIYLNAGFEDMAPICRLFMEESSKKSLAACMKILEENEEKARPLLEKELEKAKGNGKKNISAIFKKWDDGRKFLGDFKFETAEDLLSFVENNYDKTLERGSNWIEDAEISNVKLANLTDVASPKTIRFILMEYLALKEPYRIKAADKVVEGLDPKTFTDTLENLYRNWLDKGANIKQKNIMIPYCVYGTEPQLAKLRKQIEEWALSSRGTLGAYIVSAIAMNGKPFALMIVDSIANKFPHAQVKTAAQNAFGIAAKALNIPVDVLGDKIVPNLGFSADGKKTLDFGTRTFSLKLMPSFDIEITDDEKGKAIKTLPKPGASDDPAKSEAAKLEFSGLKKSLKTVIQMQTTRLQKVLLSGRTWNIDGWKELFVENPIMNAFAIKLIWGIYDGSGKLIKSFRYMEDGTFNTVEEEEYTLPEKSLISLVHPVDLTEAELAGWKQQLKDYEIDQPFSQLEAKVYQIKDGDVVDNAVGIFCGKQVVFSTITSIAKKLDMQRGGVWDGGGFWEYYLEDEVLGLGAEINFSDAYVGIDFGEIITFGTVIFYDLEKTGTLKGACTTVDKFAKTEGLDPRGLPKRFVSCVLSVIDSCINK